MPRRASPLISSEERVRGAVVAVVVGAAAATAAGRVQDDALAHRLEDGGEYQAEEDDGVEAGAGHGVLVDLEAEAVREAEARGDHSLEQGKKEKCG